LRIAESAILGGIEVRRNCDLQPEQAGFSRPKPGRRLALSSGMTAGPYIEAIHHYCDRCCWRCPFTARCACAVVIADDPAARPSNPTERVTATLVRVLEHATTRARELTSMAGALIPPSTDALAAAARAHDDKMRRLKADPLVAMSAEYALQALPLSRAVQPLVRAQPALADAAERLEEISGTLASKIFRAVSNRLDADFDPADVQSDGNGSAKIARLLIEESRRAWRALDAAGLANGVPGRLSVALDHLEAALCSLFPQALAFVRPGFDTEAASTAGQLAAAIRRADAAGCAS
jgi:hypothetical protein